MSKKTSPVSDDYFTKRAKAISERYPPEDVAAFLRMQRRWTRRVIQLQALTPIQRCAVLFIGNFATPSRPFCFASMSYICKHVGCERTTINRAVGVLEELGFMKVDRLKRGGNVYRITMPM